MQSFLQTKSKDGKKEGLISRFARSKKFLKESATALLFTIITTSFAGLFLSSYREFLLLLPGLIILIPGSINMRGTIFGAMGSRLGSAFHLGDLENVTWGNKVIKKNTKASVTLSILLPIMLAGLAKLVSVSFGIESISIFDFILIAFISSMISTVGMLAVSFSIYEISLRKDWDPDNVTAPAITSMGDLITMPSLIAAALIVMALGSYSTPIAHVVIVGAIALFLLMLRSKKGYKKIVLQALIVLPLIALIETFSGVILESHLDKLAVIPAALILLPTFMGEGGNIGSIFASKLSTLLHLGLTEPNYKMDKNVKQHLLNSYVLAAIIFTTAGATAYILGEITGLVVVSAPLLILSSFVGGLILVTIVSLTVFSMATFFYEKSVDPDNVLIPLLTAVADIVGVFCLIFTLILFGVI